MTAFLAACLVEKFGFGGELEKMHALRWHNNNNITDFMLEHVLLHSKTHAHYIKNAEINSVPVSSS